MKNLIIITVVFLLCSTSAISQSKKEWEKVQTLNSWNVYQQFILNYPNGVYTEQAKQKQSLLKQPVQVKKVAAAIPVEKSIVAAQTVTSKTLEPIELKKKRYYQNDKKLTYKDLKSILLSDPESAIEYNLAKKNSTIGAVPALTGSALVLYGTVVMLKQSNDENKAISEGNLYYQSDQSKFVNPILLGCVFALSSIPFTLASNKHLKKSIAIYNKNQTTGYYNIQKLEFGLTQNGVGVTYHFYM